MCRMHHCAHCHGALEVARLTCPACRLAYEGAFHLPRLARLEPDHQQLVEQMVLAAGNLKEVAGIVEVSYPTLRKRVDGLIAALNRLADQDEARAGAFLGEVEAGTLTPEAAARLIKELKGAI